MDCVVSEVGAGADMSLGDCSSVNMEESCSSDEVRDMEECS